jgi:hypothetical protein
MTADRRPAINATALSAWLMALPAGFADKAAKLHA